MQALPDDERDQIWRNLQNSIFKSFVLDEMIRIYQERERWANIILAFASSGSVAAWAIWEKVPLLWGSIIAGSNVITVMKPFFPFNKYLKELREKKILSLSLNLDFEKMWYKIQHNKFNGDQAMDEFFQLREKLNKAYNFNEDISLQENQKVVTKANIRTKTYLEVNYSVTINIDES